jgi:hypothetical protein
MRDGSFMASPVGAGSAVHAVDVPGRPPRSPTAVLLVLGLAVGPQGLGLLSPGALSSLDQATPVALAILGVLGGLSIARLHAAGRRLVAATLLETSVTMASVLAWIGVAVWLAVVPGLPYGIEMAVVCMVAAASSLLLPRTDDGRSRDPLTLVVEAGVVVPIIVGGVVLAAFRENTMLGALLLGGQALGAVLMLAVASWLLVGSATSETERRVFTVAAVMLIGGAADYLSLSALLGGFLAGAVWHTLAGPARDLLRTDVLYVRQPFVAVVLVLAGAHTRLSAEAAVLACLYAAARASGKLAGVGLARRTVFPGFPEGAGWRLLSPGVFGVAFALNALRAVGPELALALDVVTLGTIAADFLAGAVRRRGERQ